MLMKRIFYYFTMTSMVFVISNPLSAIDAIHKTPSSSKPFTTLSHSGNTSQMNKSLHFKQNLTPKSAVKVKGHGVNHHMSQRHMKGSR